MAMAERTGLTVGITTRNRRKSLLRCLDSLAMLGDLLTEVIVVDDSSDLPVGDALGGLHPSMAARTRVVRQTDSEGYIVARKSGAANELAGSIEIVGSRLLEVTFPSP